MVQSVVQKIKFYLFIFNCDIIFVGVANVDHAFPVYFSLSFSYTDMFMNLKILILQVYYSEVKTTFNEFK